MKIKMGTMWVVGLMTMASVVLATEPSDGDPAAEYEAGKAAWSAQQYPESAAHFRAAYALRPSWKIHYNIGQAEAAGKRYGLALEAFENFLAEGGDDVSVERQQAVMAEIVRLRNLVGYVNITAPTGAEVWMDGVRRGTAPISRELPVAASVRHQVVAKQDGVEVAEQSFQVSGGRTVDIQLGAMGPSASVGEAKPPLEAADDSPSEVPAPKKAEPSRALLIAGIAVTASGGAILVSSVITGALALRSEKELKADCPGGVCPAGYDFEAQDRRDNLSLATDILIPTGAVITAAGVGLLMVHLIRKKRSHERPGVAWVQPVVGSQRVGLVLKGQF